MQQMDGLADATNRKKDRIADTRVFRLRAPFRRVVSTWSRKAPMSLASRSSIRSRVCVLPVCG